jgi:hypothetical protein
VRIIWVPVGIRTWNLSSAKQKEIAVLAKTDFLSIITIVTVIAIIVIIIIIII